MVENPFIESEKIVWHHLNDVYVIAMPKDLHMLCMNDKGDCPLDGKTIHREKCKEILKQIYPNRLYIGNEL